MKVLLIHRWFWPDAPAYGLMLRAIAARLTREGHQVTVLTAQPSYVAETAGLRLPRRQQLDGFRVLRCRLLRVDKRRMLLRTLNMLLFMAAIFRHLVWRRRATRYDVVMASTMPPVMIAMTARWGSALTGAAFVYHMMDIYPEILRFSNLAGDGWFTRWLQAVDCRNCRKASRVIVLSGDMQETLAARGVSVANVRILNNFAPPSFAANEPVSGTLPKHLAKAPGAFRVLFAGNLGRFQGLETVVAALPLLDDLPDFRLEFLGNGVGRESLQRLAGHYVNQKVFFHGYEPLAVAKQVIATADLGLVSLNPEIYRAAYPSKVMTYLLGGTPILALVESRSELARMIDREGIGYHVPQNDPGALADTIRRAYRQRDCSGPVRARALALGERDFSPQAALSRWAELFAELASDPNARSRA